MRSADRHRRATVSLAKAVAQGPAHTPCADNGDSFSRFSSFAPLRLRRSRDQGTTTIFSDLAVAVQVVMRVPDLGQREYLRKSNDAIAVAAFKLADHGVRARAPGIRRP